MRGRCAHLDVRELIDETPWTAGVLLARHREGMDVSNDVSARRTWDDRYAAAVGSTGTVWSADAPHVVRDVSEALQPGTALDVATGDGRTATALAQRGWTVTAVDFSAVGLERARTRPGAEEVRWEVGDIHAWTPETTFDLVVVAYLHLYDNATVLRRVSEWVAPGGTFLVIGHDRANPGHGGHGPTDPAVLYSQQLFTEVLDDTFTVIKNEALYRGPDDSETTDHAGTGIDTVLHAQRNTQTTDQSRGTPRRSGSPRPTL
jgi:SAM-dependent methyltransferase